MALTSEDKFYLQTLKNGIAQGDMEAMLKWCCFYSDDHEDLITPEIGQQMADYYTACAKAGSFLAALNLGAMYYGGEYIPQDYTLAKEYYEIAVMSENPNIAGIAACNLGYCYYYGRDIPVDYAKAFKYYMLGYTLRNDANCLYKLGDMYRYGNYMEKDEHMAYVMYSQARRLIESYSPVFSDICKRLGECALYGIGREKNMLEAVNCLSKAEAATYYKIAHRDPFAPHLMPRIQQMLAEAKAQLNKELEL